MGRVRFLDYAMGLSGAKQVVLKGEVIDSKDREVLNQIYWVRGRNGLPPYINISEDDFPVVCKRCSREFMLQDLRHHLSFFHRVANGDIDKEISRKRELVEKQIKAQKKKKRETERIERKRRKKEEGTHLCEVDGCGRYFKTPAGLKRHQTCSHPDWTERKHKENNPYECSYCDSRYSSEHGLQVHVGKTHPEHSDTKRDYYKERTLKTHPHACPVDSCDALVKTEHGLKTHIGRVHPEYTNGQKEDRKKAKNEKKNEKKNENDMVSSLYAAYDAA